ncbi:uncharacterized protein LOC123306308 isoform X11 [Coccinella septempunctata]|uniref:uncharacterized protein LOC123306308 isoform X11 n=1 Tax=Coccinella septempunctata TaxID=41139 RepID=UPI001D064461|nr:uncharacterized protein LOC123306308 isoform X11 [Coccinella septempunctata]
MDMGERSINIRDEVHLAHEESKKWIWVNVVLILKKRYILPMKMFLCRSKKWIWVNVVLILKKRYILPMKMFLCRSKKWIWVNIVLILKKRYILPMKKVKNGYG